MSEKFLENYPFSDQRVRIIEGFKAYDGKIGDTPDEPHNAIDYVLQGGGDSFSFEVFSMHAVGC